MEIEKIETWRKDASVPLFFNDCLRLADAGRYLDRSEKTLRNWAYDDSTLFEATSFRGKAYVSVQNLAQFVISEK